MATFGVHIGGTSMSIAVAHGDKVEVLANPSGERVTPAVVRYMEGEQVVGTPAKQGSVRHASSTVSRACCLLSVADREAALRSPTCVPDPEKGFTVDREGTEEVHSAVDVVTTLLKSLHDVAQRQVRSEQTQFDSVFSVPVHWTPEERTVLRGAAEAAGFHVKQLVSAPAAALLAQPSPVSGVCLVVRAGGATSDAAVIRCCQGLYQVVETVHRCDLGGDALTDLVADHLASECQNKWKTDPRQSKRAMAKLRAAAEVAKRVLSSMATAQCYVESLIDGVDFGCQLTRARLESVLSPALQDWVSLAEQAVSAAGVAQVDNVVLVGGTARTPRLQSMLAAAFPSAALLAASSPDEILAEGAARQSTMLAPEDHEGPQTVAVSARAIYVQFGAAEEQLAVPAGSPVPSVHTVEYTSEAGGAPLGVTVSEEGGELSRAPLARLQVREPAQGQRLLATLVLRRQQGLRVRLVDAASGQALVADIAAAG